MHSTERLAWITLALAAVAIVAWVAFALAPRRREFLSRAVFAATVLELAFAILLALDVAAY